MPRDKKATYRRADTLWYLWERMCWVMSRLECPGSSERKASRRILWYYELNWFTTIPMLQLTKLARCLLLLSHTSKGASNIPYDRTDVLRADFWDYIPVTFLHKCAWKIKVPFVDLTLTYSWALQVFFPPKIMENVSSVLQTDKYQCYTQILALKPL